MRCFKCNTKYEVMSYGIPFMDEHGKPYMRVIVLCKFCMQQLEPKEVLPA